MFLLNIEHVVVWRIVFLSQIMFHRIVIPADNMGSSALDRGGTVLKCLSKGCWRPIAYLSVVRARDVSKKPV